tara:strand:+ start:1058 stop:1753 length:696 start_codon:yes stop_codon:yes gene_type:complete
MKTLNEFKEGKLLLIDKPLKWSSFQVVNKLRWEIKKTFDIKKIKVGHAGTLDPLATGLLLVCTGKMTKQIQELQDQKKVYSGTMTLGSTTPSYDLETDINQKFSTDHICENILRETTKQFIGEIDQYPPLYSAIKKDGKRLYEYARLGQDIDIKPRKIFIESFNITKFQNQKVDFEVQCGKGTYIRSLANDFGKALNSGAHLSSLRRTKIGDFSINDAIKINEFVESLKKN